MWIDRDQVAGVLHKDLTDDRWIDHDIEHVQGLCEVEIGEQDEPLSTRLSAVVVQIVARFWRAGEATRANPEGVQQQALDSYSYSMPVGVGLGLTNAEKKLLRKAAGLGSSIGVLRMTRGPLETAGPPGVLGLSAINSFELDES